MSKKFYNAFLLMSCLFLVQAQVEDNLTPGDDNPSGVPTNRVNTSVKFDDNPKTQLNTNSTSSAADSIHSSGYIYLSSLFYLFV